MKNKSLTSQSFNNYFAALLSKMGYGYLANRVRDYNYSLYEMWTEKREQAFFREIDGLFSDKNRPIPKISCWYHRKFLQNLFKEGKNAVREASERSKYRLEKLIEIPIDNCSHSPVPDPRPEIKRSND